MKLSTFLSKNRLQLQAEYARLSDAEKNNLAARTTMQRRQKAVSTRGTPKARQKDAIETFSRLQDEVSFFGLPSEIQRLDLTTSSLRALPFERVPRDS